MLDTFEYCVCTAQRGRITFVNGDWQGQQPLDADQASKSLDSCPEVWEYLQRAGSEGWELVSAITRFHLNREGPSFLDVLIGNEDSTTEHIFYDTLYLKRRRA